MTRSECIAQPSSLPAVGSPLWDVLISAKCALTLLSKENHMHASPTEHISQHSCTEMLSFKHFFYAEQVSATTAL